MVGILSGKESSGQIVQFTIDNFHQPASARSVAELHRRQDLAGFVRSLHVIRNTAAQSRSKLLFRFRVGLEVVLITGFYLLRLVNASG